MMDDKEKRELEEKVEEKSKDVPWYQRLNPVVIGVAGLLLFVLWRSASMNKERASSYYLWMAAIVIILYLMTRTQKTKDETVITPREAELLVEAECERKKRWGQYPFDTMCSYQVGPENPMMSKDSRGMFYHVNVRVENKWTGAKKHYVAQCMMKGISKGFVTFVQGIGEMSGREVVPERSPIPEWLRLSKEYTAIDKMLFRSRGGD